jgi:hypothetical protein
MEFDRSRAPTWRIPLHCQRQGRRRCTSRRVQLVLLTTRHAIPTVFAFRRRRTAVPRTGRARPSNTVCVLSCSLMATFSPGAPPKKNLSETTVVGKAIFDTAKPIAPQHGLDATTDGPSGLRPDVGLIANIGTHDAFVGVAPFRTPAFSHLSIICRMTPSVTRRSRKSRPEPV